MYDTIIVAVDLPTPKGFELYDFRNRVYQTKDTHCCLDTYKLENGELLVRKVESVWVEDDDHIIGGYMQTIPDSERWVKCSNITDYIYFYSSWIDITETQDAWVEFVSHIVDGNIKETRLVKFDLKGNSERKKQEEKAEKSMQAFSHRTKFQILADVLRFRLRAILLKINNKHYKFVLWLSTQIYKL
jgi:hypothetical protein